MVVSWWIVAFFARHNTLDLIRLCTSDSINNKIKMPLFLTARAPPIKMGYHWGPNWHRSPLTTWGWTNTITNVITFICVGPTLLKIMSIYTEHDTSLLSYVLRSSYVCTVVLYIMDGFMRQHNSRIIPQSSAIMNADNWIMIIKKTKQQAGL